MKRNYLCFDCAHIIVSNGKAIRSHYCHHCRVIRKRDYNRFRSEIIRIHGQKGWNNYLILLKIYAARKYDGIPIKLKTSELIEFGFVFPNGIVLNNQFTAIVTSFGQYTIDDFIVQHNQDGNEVTISQL